MRMPILLVKSATTWARQVSYTHTLTQNYFDQNSKYYIIPSSVSSLGLINFQTSEDNYANYRGKAYTEIFARMKEQDALNVLMQLEESANLGNTDCYEYMRDTYRLLKAAQTYSVANPTGDANKDINPETYTYLYIPDSVRYYDDSQTQKIYWINLFAAIQPTDAITSEELQHMRTKKTDLTWQVVEYEKYPECNETGKTLVYALSPFGSSYLRAYYESVYRSDTNFAQNSEINGSYGDYAGTNHTGADWGGRKRIANIYASASNTSVVEDENPDKSSKIFSYELNRLTTIYGETEAKQKIKAELMSEETNMPIVAVAPGVVTTVTFSARSGIYVKIKHANGVETKYMHLKRWPEVDEGDYVGAGTLIGYEGETGRAFGSHLHFELSKDGGTQSPAEYIYPSFNPFYNDELAQADGYSLGSEYMSLYRTVVMTEDGVGIENQHPTYALVDDVNDLIQNQGAVDTSMAAKSELGELGWNETISSSKEYMSYLEANKYYDLFQKEAYKDYNLAKAEGYLTIPFWLYGYVGIGDFIVNTEMPGSLPELTKEELEYIINNWLPARYGNAVMSDGTTKKVDWLMENVFTEENIDKIIASQNKYHVSAIFALAVATYEQDMGLSETLLALPPNCNIFSIQGTINGGVEYQKKDLMWNVYLNYGDAFDGFFRLIAENSLYFRNGKYTISAIAPTYCDTNPTRWANTVYKLSYDIMQYYTGSWETPFGMVTAGWFGNGTIVEIAKSCKAYYSAHEFRYCQDGHGGRTIPPYSGTAINGDFSSLPVRQSKKECPNNSNYSGLFYRTDCSTYVSWVLYEYGVKNNITEFIDTFDSQQSSGAFETMADNLKSGAKTGIYAHMQLIYHIDVPNGDPATLMKEGDILIYRRDSHHVEICAGKWPSVYNCGGNSGIKAGEKATSSAKNLKSNLTAIIRIK